MKKRSLPAQTIPKKEEPSRKPPVPKQTLKPRKRQQSKENRTPTQLRVPTHNSSAVNLVINMNQCLQESIPSIVKIDLEYSPVSPKHAPACSKDSIAHLFTRLFNKIALKTIRRLKPLPKLKTNQKRKLLAVYRAWKERKSQEGSKIRDLSPALPDSPSVKDIEVFGRFSGLTDTSRCASKLLHISSQTHVSLDENELRASLSDLRRNV